MADVLTRFINVLGIARAVFVIGAGMGFAAGMTVGAALTKFVTPRK